MLARRSQDAATSVCTAVTVVMGGQVTNKPKPPRGASYKQTKAITGGKLQTNQSQHGGQVTNKPKTNTHQRGGHIDGKDEEHQVHRHNGPHNQDDGLQVHKRPSEQLQPGSCQGAGSGCSMVPTGLPPQAAAGSTAATPVPTQQPHLDGARVQELVAQHDVAAGVVMRRRA